MTTDDRRTLSDALITRALARRTPDQAPSDLLAQIMQTTSRVPQTVARPMPWRRIGVRRASALFVVALLLLALAAWIVGQQQPTPEPSGGLAYVGDGDVYVASSDGTSAVKLLDDPAVDFARVTTLDDRQLAVEGAGVITLVDPATGAHRRAGITDGTTTWSPGAHSYAFSRRTASGTPVTVFVDVATGRSRELPGIVPAGEGSWSPNGRWLVSAPDDGSVVIVDAATGSRKATILPASDNPAEIQDIAWSPDSSAVSLVAQVPGMCDLGSAPTTAPGATSAPFECAAGHTQVLVAAIAGASGTGKAEPITADISDAPSQYLVGPGMAIAWSPDGRWIAYRARSGLSIVRPDGTEGRVLVASPIGWFAWSADSSGLDFVATKTPDDVAGDLSWIGLADSTPRSLHVDGVGEVASIGLPASSITATVPQSPAAASTVATAVLTPAPAPDADPAETWRGLVFAEYQDPCTQVRQLDFGSDSEPHAVTDCAGQARVSPDGLHAAAGRSRRGGSGPGHKDSVDIIDLRTGAKTPVDGGSPDVNAIDWSPGGRWLGWFGGITDLNGRARIDLPVSDFSSSLPVWSPDDSHVSVAMPDGLLIGVGSGADLHNIGAFPRVSSWSSDGSRFVFLRDGDAWIARSDGAEVRNLTGFEFGGAGQMALSPDGAILAVVQGGTTLWLIGLDGTRQHVDLGPDVSLEDAWLSWSADGERIAVDVGQALTTYLVTADGSSVIRLDHASSPTWSPDGRFLAVLTNHDRVGTIDIANADGSGRFTVTTTAVDAVSDLAWVPRS